MSIKNRVLFAPLDKIDLRCNMVSNNVIVIKYNSENYNYNKLLRYFTLLIKKYYIKITDIESICLISPEIDTYHFESFIINISNLLTIVNKNKNPIKIDIIGLNNPQSGDILSRVATNSSTIINYTLSNMTDNKYVLDCSTTTTKVINRRLICRYFTPHVKKCNLDIVKSAKK